MANMEAIERAAAGGGGMGGMGGMGKMNGMGGEATPKTEGPAQGGLDAMMSNLEGVAGFLKTQADGGNPAAKEAMGHFQAMVQSMMKIAEGGPSQAESMPSAGPERPGNGRIHESQAPGVQVL